MRILHLITIAEPGGAQSIVRTLAENGVNSGDTIAIGFGTEAGSKAWQDIDGRVELFPIKHLIHSISISSEIPALVEVSRLYRKWLPDVVHLHTSKAAAVGRLAPGMDRRRIVYTMHGFDQLRKAHPGFLPIDRALRKLCGAIVAVSSYDEMNMLSGGYTPVLIPNGVADATRQKPITNSITARLATLRASGKFVACVIAREAKPKRIDLARDVARCLGEKTVIFWIGGDTRPDDPPNFIAAGVLPEASAYLHHVDCLLLPSDHEGMPVSLLEAFSAGLPVIVSNVGGMSMLVSADEAAPCGIVVENTPEAFAKAMRQLSDDPRFAHSLGCNARAAWESCYSVSRMANAYGNLYKSICAQ